MNKYLDYLKRNTRKLNEARKTKTLVLILSTMRSGSTLLKSLLANASDVSHLPEVDFQKYQGPNAWKLKTLSPARIVVLKKPAPFDQPDYPRIPKVNGVKKIVLIRDVYETVNSLQKMNETVYPEVDAQWSFEKLIHEYWCPTIKNIMTHVEPSSPAIKLLRYEDLVANPMEQTHQLFQWMGSVQKKGVETYAPSDEHPWQWGKDDGGEKIKSLKIQSMPSPRDNSQLMTLIQESPEVMDLRRQLGYIN